MKCAVVGASGFVGGAVVARLSAAGMEVVPVTAPRLDWPRADAAEILLQTERLPEADLLADAIAGADVVVNAAGLASPDAGGETSLLGANALLPAVIARACERAGVRRLVHISSAAVQGRRRRLDESPSVEPFSPYSRSKALGEEVLRVRQPDPAARLDIVILRATSVQGPGRATTVKLQRIAASVLSSVAGPGQRPTPVTSVLALAELVSALAAFPGTVSATVLQPAEGLTTSEVLELAGGRPPRHLPEWLCRGALGLGFGLSRLAGSRFHGALRRLEVMWFGQDQVPGWAAAHGVAVRGNVREVLTRRQ